MRGERRGKKPDKKKKKGKLKKSEKIPSNRGGSPSIPPVPKALQKPPELAMEPPMPLE